MNLDLVKQHMTRARVRLLIEQPFWATTVMELRLRVDTDIPTACTDGKSIDYNPEFAFKLTPGQRIFLMAHEGMHVLSGHHIRMGDREHERWNAACDFEINGILIRARVGEEIANILHSSKYYGWTAERIYDDLKPEQYQGKGGGCGEVKPLRNPDGSPLNPAQRAVAETVVRGMLQRAAAAAKARGKMPGGMEELIDELLDPQLPWPHILRRFVTNTSRPSDFTWQKFSRRALSRGEYLPGVIKEGCGTIVTIFDTSGSMSITEIKHCVAEMAGIKEEVNPERMVIIAADADVQWTGDYSADEDIDFLGEVKAKGRQGTSFRPAFDWLEAEGIEPQAVIYFTDMDGDFPQQPSYPVMWINTDGPKPAPFGEVIKLNAGRHQ